MTDKALIQRARDGDEQAFKELVQKYESRIAATITGMLGHCPEVDDVGQETFIRFYYGLHKFRGDSSISTYLTRIAINLSLNELKRRKRKFSLFPKSSEDVRDQHDEFAHIEQNEAKQIVQQALQDLGPKFRAVVVLRLIDGYSTKETARILNVPEGTVLSRLARAQRKMSRFLSQDFGGSNEPQVAKTFV